MASNVTSPPSNGGRKTHRRRHKHRGAMDMVAVCLWDGPLTVSEIQEHFVALARRFGVLVEIYDQKRIDQGELIQELLIALRRMEQQGWVELDQESYELTPLGREKAAKILAGLRKAGDLARRLTRPETVSKIGLAAHLILAAIKLPAGFLSGSIGLINDGADTLLDGLGSLLVYVGLRLKRERQVNFVLVLLMLGTGLLTLYEAVRRFFVLVQPEVDWFSFGAAAMSALVCLGLWGYQRYVGLRTGTMALITQSVDSRNHVIVAAGVTAGLVASWLDFGLLDTLAGLVVALLILKSAVLLVIDSVRSLGGGEINLSHYRLGLLDRYERFRQEQLRDFLLYLVAHEGLVTTALLEDRVARAWDFTANPALRAAGLDRPVGVSQWVGPGLRELIDRGWLAGDARFEITPAGWERLRRLGRPGQGHPPSAGGRNS